MYGNTGLDFFVRSAGTQVAFYDVRDGDAMLAAIEAARSS
jgi:hypothetical protein